MIRTVFHRVQFDVNDCHMSAPDGLAGSTAANASLSGTLNATVTTKQPTTPSSATPVPSAPPSTIGGVGGGQTAGTGTAPAKEPTHETGRDVEPGRGEGSTGASRGSDHGVTGVDAAPADDAADATSGSASGHASR